MSWARRSRPLGVSFRRIRGEGRGLLTDRSMFIGSLAALVRVCHTTVTRWSSCAHAAVAGPQRRSSMLGPVNEAHPGRPPMPDMVRRIVYELGTGRAIDNTRREVDATR